MSPALRRFFLSVFVGCVAMGLTLSLYIVYLHNAHHFSVVFATELLAAAAIVSLASAPLWGTLTDRVGPVPSMVLSGLASAASLVGWAYIHTTVQAVMAGLCLAVFSGAGWGPGSTLLTRLCPEEHRQRAYGFNFALVNLGIGVGSLVSALIVNLSRPITFHYLYLINAGVSIIAALIVMPLWHQGRHVESSDSVPEGGWLVVLRDRHLLLYMAAALFMMIGGYGSLESGFSLYVVNVLHVSVHAIGVIFLISTVAIVVMQLPVINLIAARSRMGLLALSATCWSVFWFVLALDQHVSAGLAVVTLSLAMVVFAMGEVMMAPVGSAFINDAAPEHLRGRYNAASGLTFSVASFLSPLITGLYFNASLARWWPLATGGAALVGAGLFLLLRQFISPAQDGRVLPPR